MHEHASLFATQAELAAQLLPFAVGNGEDGSHDVSHLLRVWKNVQAIHVGEGGNLRILCAATLLHDCVSVEKNSPQRAQASQLAADKACGLLHGLGWNKVDMEATAHAIAAHSFSANIAPQTIEAKILQDADRLDAIGMIGVARCFYIAGRMGSALYDWQDLMAERRELDDRNFAIDHFRTKLFGLSQGFKTATGQQMAAQRHASLTEFYNDFLAELVA